MTDNRTNEPTEAQVEAAAKAIDPKAFRDGEPEARALEAGGDFRAALADQAGRLRTRRHHARKRARAALTAAGTAPQAESDSVWELIGGALQTPPGGLTGDEYRRQLIQVLEDRHGAATGQPSSTVDEAFERAKFRVESVHHIHGVKCLCGYESARSRSRTEHITDALLAEWNQARAVVEAIGGEGRG